MKIIHETGLFCPFCNSSNVVIKKNASKDFQVYCEDCGSNNGWHTKPQAIIRWFLMAIQHWKNNGVLTIDTQKD